MYMALLNSVSKRLIGKEHVFHTVKFYSGLLQMCATHPGTVPLSYYAEKLSTDNTQMVTKTMEQVKSNFKTDSQFEQNVKQTLDTLSETSCVICMCPMERPTITPCLHLFCHDCIMENLNHKQLCPMCRQPISTNTLVEISNEASETSQEDGFTQFTVGGTTYKMSTEMYDAVQAWHHKESSRKIESVKQALLQALSGSTIIFSRFNSVLHKLKIALSGTDTEIITGRSTRSQRKKAIERFQSKESKLFILSSNCASIGLTLTAASNIIFMEPSLDDATTQQAIGRIARTGQKNEINIYILSSKHTMDQIIEENPLKEKMKTIFGSAYKRELNKLQRSVYLKGFIPECIF